MKKLLLLTILILVGLPAVSHAALTDGLAGYWTMDGVDTLKGVILDRSGNNNHGNAISIATSTFYVPGKIGQGAYFVGSSSQYINLPDITSTNSATALTLATWVKFNSLIGDEEIIGKYNGSFGQGLQNGQTISSVCNSFKQIIFFINNGASYVCTTNDVILKTNAWYHVVATWDNALGSSKYRIYINGASQALTNQATPDSYTTTGDASGANNRIGSLSSAFPRYLNGTVDDVRIYTRAISANEAMQLYNYGKEKYLSPIDNLNFGLQGWWTMDGIDTLNGVIRDRSGNGKNGNTVSISTTTFYIPGKIGQAGNFDGTDDRVNLGTAINPTAVTYSAWIMATAFTNPYNGVIARNDNTNYTLLDIKSSGKLSLFVKATADVSYDGTGSNTLVAGKWYHVVLTYDSTNGLKGYVNGQLDGSVAANGNITTNALEVDIGNDLGVSPRFFTGKIDDARIYNRALSQTEVNQLYNYGKDVYLTPNINAPGGLNNGLTGYWTLDGKDITKGRINDVSGNNNHGNIINIATSTFYVPGKIGQTGNFDGTDDYITVPDVAGLRPGTGAWAISTWIKPKNILATGGLVSKRDTSTLTSFTLFAGTTDGSCNLTASKKISLVVYDGNASSGGCVHTTNDVQDGRWHHIVAQKNSNTGQDLAIYVDGIQMSLTTDLNLSTGATNINTTFPWIVGCFTAGTTCFNGLIDDLRLYNRVITATEVQQLYNFGRSKHK